MFGIIPYTVDVPMQRMPYASMAIVPVTVAFYFGHAVTANDPLILRDVSFTGLVGYQFLHLGFWHLFGNMLFLWVFGNGVCAKVGNGAYPFVYVGLGIVAGLVHVALSDDPVVGASGAINGIVGMYLILYPLNTISCVWFFLLRFGQFSVDSYVMILFWLAFDIWGVVRGSGGVAYWAHIGGFLAGAALASGLIVAKVVEMDRHEKSLLEVLGWR